MKTTKLKIVGAAFAALFLVGACGETVEQRAATGALGGAAIAGPPGAAVGGAAGALSN
jgi:osmotically inducible lipoprotein OsmB